MSRIQKSSQMSIVIRSCLLFGLFFVALTHGFPTPGPQAPRATSTAPATSSAVSTSVESDIKELEPFLSAKLVLFLQKLANVHPQLLEAGELKLANLKLMGRDEMEEILQNSNPEELKQFKSDLAQVAKLISKYPGAKKLVQISILGSALATGTEDATSSSALSSTKAPGTTQDTSAALGDIDPFFEEFTKVDKELSAYPEWNRYWTFWFRRYGDYMAKYG